MTTAAVLGATSGIAQACLRLWAEQGFDLILVGRDGERLDAGTADLRARGAGSVKTVELDLGSAEGVAQAVERVYDAGPIDLVFIAFGVMPEQTDADASPPAAQAVLDVTGSLNTLALHWSTLRMLDQGSGTVAVLGSVAGDRGRRTNYLYGAAKAMVATAAAGLQHRVADTDVSVVLVKPGPTQTPMTDHLTNARRMAGVTTVARCIVDGIERRKPVVYAPPKWRIIMTIVRLLPRRLFHRTGL